MVRTAAYRPKLRDLGGPLAIAGKVHIAAAGSLRRRPRRCASTIRRWRRLLKFIGERTPDGGSLLRIEGELRPLW